MLTLASWRAGRARVVLALALTLSLIGATYAVVWAVTSNDGPFTGCLATKTNKQAPVQKGQLYNVKVGSDPLAACLAGDPQVAFSNAQGPQGPQGIQGPQGPKGDAGEPGFHPVVRWYFDLPAGPDIGSSVSGQTVFPPGTTLTSVAAYLTSVSEVPPDCSEASVTVRATVPTAFLANWTLSPDAPLPAAATAYLGNTSGPVGVPTTLRVDEHCFDSGHSTTASYAHVQGYIDVQVHEPPFPIP